MDSENLPKIGLGTWQLKPKQAINSVQEAIKIGYRLIDTAQMYGNEEEVGKAINLALETLNLNRKDIFLATKLSPMKLKPKKVRKSALKSLKKLQSEYIDLLYVHWPAFKLGYSHEGTLKILSELQDEGIIHHIGISNFTIPMVSDAQKQCDKPIFANQIEAHPYLPQTQMLKYLAETNVHFVAYSPLARGHIFEDETITSISRNLNLNPAQVVLAWLIQKGAIPIPKATSVKHLTDNFKALSVTLSSEDIEKLDNISTRKRYVQPPLISPKAWKK